MDDQIMTIRGLTKRYNGLAAVDGMNVEFATGTITGIVGPNGAGKTTLFGLISGAVKADEGSVAYLGRDITRLSARRRAHIGIARTFQTARVFPSLTVRDNLLVGIPAASGSRPAWFRSRRLPGAGCVALVERTAADHGLTGVLGRPAASLPQALRKRLDLAIALLQRPTLLLLDEPTAGVGGEDVASIERALLDLRRGGQVDAILITSHDVDLISRIADTLMVMVQGRRIAFGPTAEVVRDPEVKRAYLGMGRA